MKENKNKKRQKDQQQNTNNERQDISSNRTAGRTGTEGASGQSDKLNIPEKKVISHRTGDATNFGDRSYNED